MGNQKFKCIATDPPWMETGGGKSTRGCQAHYDPIPTSEIIKVMKGWLWGDLIDRNERVDRNGAHLWLWATDTFLMNGDAFRVMAAMGFRPVASWQWVKLGEVSVTNTIVCSKPSDLEITNIIPHDIVKGALQLGLGQYSRKCHEHLLLGTLGGAMVPPSDRRPPSVLFAPRPCIPGTKKPKHSAKPQKAYEIMEQVSPGPRLECFARPPVRNGWTALGNEV